MQKWTLKSGMTLLYEPRSTDSVAIQVLVNVGSNSEPARVRGITHFLEHLVFEGTPSRPDAKTIANEIERLGGEMNAYTTNDRTCFHAKVLRKHAPTAIAVLADIMQNPLLRESDAAREKNVVLKEIELTTDEPRFHQWVLFQQTLFKRHPSRYPTHGTRASVARTTAAHMRAYFEQYYVPRNMVISVVGTVPNLRQLIEQQFAKKPGQKHLPRFPREPFPKAQRRIREKRPSESTYLLLGHLTVPRLHPDSSVLDVIDAVLGRGQSGWMFNEVRNKHGLAYEVGTQNVAESDYGYFATFANVSRTNKEKAAGLILNQLERLQQLTADELAEAKTYIEGDFYLSHEDTQKRADELVVWEQLGDVRLLDGYMRKIGAVSLADVRRVAKRYLGKNYCLVVIEGKR